MSESVIVAPGLWMPGLETKLLRYRLTNAGFRTYSFEFPSMRGTLERNAQLLARFAEQAVGDRLHFVGHSLGGVVTLRMLAQTHLPRVGRIVCLGSPLVGSRAAAWLAGTNAGRRVVGKTMLDHLEEGGCAPWDRHQELGIIAGTRSFGIGRFMQTMPVDNDGTVAVDETRLPGATAHLTLPVTHTQLLFDRKVARQTIHFLRNGHFVEPEGSGEDRSNR
jgi:pimeloyl-ACP methyl ester carboxylesterase